MTLYIQRRDDFGVSYTLYRYGSILMLDFGDGDYRPMRLALYQSDELNRELWEKQS